MTCRPIGWGLAPIPWTAVARYAEVHSFDYDQFCDLVYFVRELDSEYFAWEDKKTPKGGGKIGGG